MGLRKQPPVKDEEQGLIGHANEAAVVVEGRPATALLDTGSSVSTVSQSYHSQFLSHLEIRPLECMLDIECADGQQLPYLGLIETQIEVKDLLA